MARWSGWQWSDPEQDGRKRKKSMLQNGFTESSLGILIQFVTKKSIDFIEIIEICNKVTDVSLYKYTIDLLYKKQKSPLVGAPVEECRWIGSR